MNTLIQHAKLAIRMNNNGINREFIKKFPIEEIIDCCNRIEQNKILNDEYKDNEVIQEEIIKDDCKHSRIPVYDETVDEIKGILYVKDIIKNIYTLS